eukprot:scaffold391453_cov16-Prasinocladus_malaysianus.AAC.1
MLDGNHQLDGGGGPPPGASRIAVLVMLLWAMAMFFQVELPGLPPPALESIISNTMTFRLYQMMESATLAAMEIVDDGSGVVAGLPAMSKLRVTKHRIRPPVPRKGWAESPLQQALSEYDDIEFRKRLR